MEKVIKQIKKARHLLLASHCNPDGDAISSLLAMGLALDKLDKKVTLYNASPIPAVYRLITALKAPINKAIATAIYTGILTDTGSFRFSNTNQAAFAISQEMVQYGVRPYSVAQHVFGTYSLGRIKLLNLALDSIEISKNGKLSIMTLTNDMFEETGTQPEDVDGMINYARRIEDVKVAALIQEQKNGDTNSGKLRNFHVSLRSDGTVDVAAMAGAFGGGGHSSAAGFQVETSMAKLKSDIITLSDNL